MNLTNEQLKALAASSDSWLRGKIDDAEVDKCTNLIIGANKPGADNETVTGMTGSVTCVVFYWRITLDTPDGAHHYTGNAGGLGTVGAGAIVGGALMGVPNMDTLYRSAVSFQFNSAAAALNVNFFDSNSVLVGSFIGGSVGICLGTGGGSGTWS